MTDNNTNNNGSHNQPQGNPPNGNGGSGGNSVDFVAMINGLLAAGNRRRLVLRHRGETVLRLPLTVVVLITLILLWQSAFLLVALVALVFFTQTQISFERRSDIQPPYRD